MPSRSQVLVVDRQTDMRDVLRAVLEPRGVTVERVTPGEAAQLKAVHSSPRAAERTSPPHLLVIDADATASAMSAMQRWPQVPCIVVGRFEVPVRPNSDRDPTASARIDRNMLPQSRSNPPDEHRAATAVLAKPFAYGDLIERILAIIPAE